MKATWTVPGGLPPGQLIIPDPQYADGPAVTEPVLWISDDPVPDPGSSWARLLLARPETGCWPLLLTGRGAPRGFASRAPAEWLRRQARRPWHSGELCPVPGGGPREPDAERVLAAQWEPDAVSPGPYRSWPGLADPARPGTDPCQHAANVAAMPGGIAQLTGRDRDPYLGLVPAPDGASAITRCGWTSQAGGAADVAAVIRSWQGRFGLRLCALGPDTLGAHIAWPPAAGEHSRHVAAEHYAFCPDLADVTSFGEYAHRLSRAPVWRFWWD